MQATSPSTTTEADLDRLEALRQLETLKPEATKPVEEALNVKRLSQSQSASALSDWFDEIKPSSGMIESTTWVRDHIGFNVPARCLCLPQALQAPPKKPRANEPFNSAC